MPSGWTRCSAAIIDHTGRSDGKSRNATEVNHAIGRLAEIIRGHYDRIRRDLGFVTAEAVKIP